LCQAKVFQDQVDIPLLYNLLDFLRCHVPLQKDLALFYSNYIAKRQIESIPGLLKDFVRDGNAEETKSAFNLKANQYE